jgi:uncharacterized protein (DUF433 family)
VSIACIRHFKRAIRPLQVFQLLRLVQQPPLRIEGEEIIRQDRVQVRDVAVFLRLDVFVAEVDDFLDRFVILARLRVRGERSDQKHHQSK